MFTQNLLNKQNIIDENTEHAMLKSNAITENFVTNRFVKFFI